MKEVKRKIKMIKAEDGAVALPGFRKLDDGNYVVDGAVDVSKTTEIREYLREYKEIADLIRENYRREISQIFYSALGELVGRTSAYRGDFSTQRTPVEALGGEFNDTQFLSRFAAGKGLSQKTIERILASDGLGVKRYKPGKEIIDLMKMSDSTGYMVLPEMSDYGVVATPDKSTKTISLRFKKFNGQDAEIIKNYLLSVAEGVEYGDLCKKKIEEMFDTSKALAEVNEPYSEEERHLLFALGQQAVDLMGVDLTPFKKKAKVKTEPTNPDVSADELSGEELGGGEGFEQDLTLDEQGNGTDPISGKITRIVVNGLNNFSQGVNNGQFQIVLSPTDGFIYTIKMDGEALVADQTPTEPSRE